MLTPFGKQVRKYRLDLGMKLIELASQLGVSAAYLSAVESGKKNATAAFALKVSAALNLDALQTRDLQDLAESSRRAASIELEGTSEKHRELAMAFARNFSDLDQSEVSKMLEFLQKKGKGEN